MLRGAFSVGQRGSAVCLPRQGHLLGDVTGYRPSYFFKPRPTITASPASVAHGAAFSVDTATPATIVEVVLMRAGAVTHGFNQNQRYVGCAITGTTATAVNATAPPDGTIAPPGNYLLFVVNTDRAPSEGKWIRLTP